MGRLDAQHSAGNTLHTRVVKAGTKAGAAGKYAISQMSAHLKINAKKLPQLSNGLCISR